MNPVSLPWTSLALRSNKGSEASAVRRKVAEHVRIRWVDYYGVLMIAHFNANAENLGCAGRSPQRILARFYVARWLGLDQYKLEELHRLIARARHAF